METIFEQTKKVARDYTVRVVKINNWLYAIDANNKTVEFTSNKKAAIFIAKAYLKAFKEVKLSAKSKKK